MLFTLPKASLFQQKNQTNKPSPPFGSPSPRQPASWIIGIKAAIELGVVFLINKGGFQHHLGGLFFFFSYLKKYSFFTIEICIYSRYPDSSTMSSLTDQGLKKTTAGTGCLVSRDVSCRASHQRVLQQSKTQSCSSDFQSSSLFILGWWHPEETAEAITQSIQWEIYGKEARVATVPLLVVTQINMRFQSRKPHLSSSTSRNPEKATPRWSCTPQELPPKVQLSGGVNVSHPDFPSRKGSSLTFANNRTPPLKFKQKKLLQCTVFD